MLTKILEPYLEALIGAAWTLQQVLDALGLAASTCLDAPECKPFACPCWSPGQNTTLILGYLIILAVAILGFWLMTGYVLWRKRGIAIAMAIALTPGALHLLNAWPIGSAVPDTYVIGGDGALGGVWGMVTLVFLAALSGWIMLIIVVDIARVGERFWQTYDHLWYATGLLAGVFFVGDARGALAARDFQENAKSVQGASAYLLSQVREYESWCNTHGKTDLSSCDWAYTVQQRLLDLSTWNPVLFPTLGPKTENELYGAVASPATDAEVLAIRSELAEYNWDRCPMRRVSDNEWAFEPTTSKCLQTPPDYCRVRSSKLPNAQHSTEPMVLLVLDDCIISTLVALRSVQEKAQARAEGDTREKYEKWFYFLGLSVVAGGRIAYLTTKLTGMNLRPASETRRSVHLVKRTGLLSVHAAKALYSVTRGFVHILRGIARRITTRGRSRKGA